MGLKYLVAKEKGGKYFVHEASTPNRPIPGSFGDKRSALRFAAMREGISFKAYVRCRKREMCNET